VDKEYKSGTALVNDENGRLTRARIYEKTLFPERIVATYYKREIKTVWGPEQIQVNNRSWVKVR
jgi:hypothetical protein